VFARDHVKKARVLVFDKEDACVLEVVEGKAGAFIYDQISTYQNWRRNQETTRPILKPFQEESWAVGLRMDDAQLRGKVNAFLKEFKGRGGFEELGDRWLKDQKEAFRKLGYPFYF
jgi:polar amino acid transport system substrate-binding protein